MSERYSPLMGANIMKITHELLDSLKSDNGGYTKAVLTLLGVAWNKSGPAHGWQKLLIGTTLTDEKLKGLRMARNTLQPRQRDRHRPYSPSPSTPPASPIRSNAQPGDWENDPITEKQIALLISLGVDEKAVERLKTKGEARRAIDILKVDPYATDKQRNYIRLYRLATESELENMSRADASTIIGKHKAPLTDIDLIASGTFI